MTWGKEIHSAIERRDATALRSMAEEARKEGTRMFLNLLADLIHQRPKKATQFEEDCLAAAGNMAECGCSFVCLTCRDGGTVAEEALKQCVTCERFPLTLYAFSGGVIAHVRFGCLCSSVILHSDSEQTAVIPVGARLQVMKPA